MFVIMGVLQSCKKNNQSKWVGCVKRREIPLATNTRASFRQNQSVKQKSKIFITFSWFPDIASINDLWNTNTKMGDDGRSKILKYWPNSIPYNLHSIYGCSKKKKKEKVFKWEIESHIFESFIVVRDFGVSISINFNGFDFQIILGFIFWWFIMKIKDFFMNFNRRKVVLRVTCSSEILIFPTVFC